MVGKGYQTESGFKLAGWVFSQRTTRKQGLLPEHKIAQLDSLQFVWDANEYLWELGFQELKLYFEENGNTLVPEKKRDGINYPLANWVGTQKRVYRSVKVSKNRVYKLKELNFAWDPLEFLWQENLEELREFIKHHGHANISNNYKTKSGGSLRDWIQDQRQSKKNGNLTTTRKNKLDLIGLNWQPSDDFWKEGIQYLKKYTKFKKSANLPLRFVTEDGFALGNWVSTRRRNYKRGILSREAIAELDQLGFTWDALGDKWIVGTQHLKSFVADNGHCWIRTDFVTKNDFNLGQWVASQPQNRRKEKLTSKRIAELDSPGFVWENKSSWSKND